MSREIKFRFWDTVHENMIDMNTYGMNFLFESKGVEVFDDTYHIFMQYTGLNDNSDCLLDGVEDKDVFEGDIVSVSYRNQTVKAYVDFGMGVFTLVSDEFYDGYIPISEVSNIDGNYQWIDGIVIGNIYENKELLEDVVK